MSSKSKPAGLSNTRYIFQSEPSYYQRIKGGVNWSFGKANENKGKLLTLLVLGVLATALIFHPQLLSLAGHHPGYTAALAGGTAGAMMTGGLAYKYGEIAEKRRDEKFERDFANALPADAPLE